MAWPGHRLAAILFALTLLAGTAAIAGVMRAAAVPPAASGTLLAVFPPAMAEDAVFAALIAAGGRPIRPTWIGSVWVVAGDEAGFAGRLKERGALAAYRELPVTPQLAGCFAWADARAMEIFTARP